MWSHYADSHKGVMVELNPRFCKTDPFEVSYTGNGYDNEANKLVSSAACDFLINPFGEADSGESDRAVIFSQRLKMLANKFIFTKHEDWKYEKELRIAFRKEEGTGEDGRYLPLGKGAVRSVTFGARMEDSRAEELKQIIHEDDPSIKIYRNTINGWDLLPVVY
nr:DUF2971 domain-containing protein [Erwinia sp. S38]